MKNTLHFAPLSRRQTPLTGPCGPLRLGRLALAAASACIGFSATAQSFIGEVQGSSHISPFANKNVAGIKGIVTAVSSNGFWMQDAGDGKALTSDAIFVFRSSATKPVVGDAVTVAGLVQEFRAPGGSPDPNNLTVTQINASGTLGSWSRQSGGNVLPTALNIGAGFLPPTSIAPKVGNIETAPGYTLSPAAWSIDFYESMEGMRVGMQSARVVGATNNFGEISLIASAQVGQAGTVATPRGGIALAPGQFNGHRLYIDDPLRSGWTMPVVNVGAELSGVVGVMDYSFNNFKLLVTGAPNVVSNTLKAEVVAPRSGFSLGSYNVENLGGNAPQAKIDGIATQLAVNMAAPHIVALQEVQDNSGSTNNGVVAADVTLNRLTTAVNLATGRTYAWVNVNPADGADGGQPGGNIRTAFLYDTSRVTFAGVVGGALDGITATNNGSGQIQLNLGAGRIDPGNSAWNASRKPLVTEFSVDGQQMILVNNHFNSKNGDEPLYGPNQEPDLSTAAQRLAQAQSVASFVAGLLAINPNANIVVMGDLNDFQFADTLDPLTAAGLSNMTLSLAEGERYSYNFQGNAQSLDHMFVSANLLKNAGLVYDIVHINSEFSNASGAPARVSDHDPLLLSFGSVPAPIPEPGTYALMLLGLAAVWRAQSRRKA